jgi:hypothetical protein
MVSDYQKAIRITPNSCTLNNVDLNALQVGKDMDLV